MSKWIAEFDLEDGDTMPEHMELEYKGARIDFHCKPLEQEPCEDAISRADAINAMSNTIKRVFPEHRDIAEKTMNKLPPVIPQPKIGHWIDRFPAKECKCSVCNFLICISNGSYIDMVGQMKYCPNCGAKMQEVTE